MLAKKYRLPIQSVLNKSGRTFRSRSFLIKSFLSSLDFNRFGVVISKKVSKLAVKRNLIKRIVLDLTKNFVNTESKSKSDILIIISPVMIKMEKADIIKELEDSLQRILGV
ncbi:MAG: ribonuclease P protein component [Minisyncoccota bacterium]